MRTIIILAIKDLRLLTRDLLGMFFIVAFPILMGVLFGLINSSFESEPGRGSMRIAVVDDDDSEMSRLFIEKLRALDAVSAETMGVKEATRRVRKGKLVGFVEIPKGFGRTAGIFWAQGPALKLGVDPARRPEGAMLQGMIMQAMGAVIQHRFMHPAGMRPQLGEVIEALGSDATLPSERRANLLGFLRTVDRFLGVLDGQLNVLDAQPGANPVRRGPSMEFARIETVDVTVTGAGPEQPFEQLIKKLRSPWDISFPLATMWGVMACVAGFAISIARERTAGTFFRLQIAPITRTQLLAGKACACFLAVLGVIMLMLGLGLVLGIQLARPGLLVMAAVSTALGFVGLMMLMSVLGRTEQAVSGAGWAVIIVMCMFGGGMIPLAFMPPFMKTISHFSPVKWGVLALEGAVWRGFSLSEMLLPCGILLAIGAGCFALGAKVLSRADL